MLAAALIPLAGIAAPPSASLDDAEGAAPSVTLVLTNPGRAREVRFQLYDEAKGANVVDEVLRAEAGTSTTASFAAPPSRYFASVVDEPGGAFGPGADTDTRGCEGVFEFAVELADLGGRLAGAGCTVPSAAALALLDAARDASEGRARGPSLEIPMPRAGDRGSFLSWSSNAPVDWSDATPRNFSWVPNASAFDEQGAAVSSPRVLYELGTIGCGAIVGPIENEVESGDAARSVQFEPGSAVPLLRTFFGCSAGLVASPSGARDDARLLEITQFGRTTPEGCLFRQPLQGSTLAPGTDVTGRVACGEWGDDGSRWTVGATVEARGFRAVPVYGFRGSEASFFAARVLFADGVAYPLEVEAFAYDGRLSHLAFTLLTLRPEGDEIPRGERRDAPAGALAPIDAARGPAGSEALPFPLAMAADAAWADPTLLSLQGLGDTAHLAGALLQRETEPGLPRVDAWALLFADDAGGRARVRCERVADALLPAVRCSEGYPASTAAALGEAPAEHRLADIPATGASFSLALDRWMQIDPEAASAGATFARYRAWPAGAASIEVGDAPAGNAVDLPVAFQSTAPFSTLAVSLADGASRTSLRGVVNVIGVAELPAEIVGVEPARPNDAAFVPAAPAALLVGSGILLALLVALLLLLFTRGAWAGLFTRLVRPRVLDAQMRSDIHALVQERPGVHAREIVQHFNRGTGLVEYHLDVLVREGFLTSLKTAGFRHYFPAGRYSPQQTRAIAALRVGQAEKLYRIIAGEPGIGMAALVERSGLSQGYVSKEVKRLSQAGLVDATRSGREVELRAVAPAAHGN